MKNILIYIKGKGFDKHQWEDESMKLLKVQIDNSQLYWKREDIWLITNFPYEYNGVKAIEVIGDFYYYKKPTVTKVKVLYELFFAGLIEEGEMYWFHDLDAFQLAPVIVNFKEDMALTDYGITTVRESYNSRWSTGSWFFKKSAFDLFEKILERSQKDKINEEAALGRLLVDQPELRERIHKLNITFNVATRKRNVEETLEQAIKPLRVLHFHPFDNRKLWNGKTNMEYCPALMPKELNEIFKKNL